MGNSMSDNEEEGKADCSINPDEDLSDGQDDSDDDHKPLTDLCQLFEDNATLRALATKVKEKIPENVILQHHAHILSWLEGRQEMGEENITLAQFCDMMMSQGVERPDAVKAFHQFDCDGSGMADMETMTIAIETYSSRSALGELGKSIRILQSCSLTPGFVDLYAGTSNVEKHGTRMLKYLLRNRVESKAMPFPYLSSFYNVQIMRTSVLQSALQSNTLADKEPETEMDGDDYEKRTIENCYSNLEVSSNSSDSQLLRHPSMYWQSDGAARSHWVRIQVRPQVVIKHLSIGVSSTDQSYMPEQVIISVGHTTLRMRDIKEVKIQNHVNGQVVLLKNMKTHYPIVQIYIRRCHGDGCDTRIHGIKMTGYRMIKDAGMSVMDASALWYLQVLTSTVTFTLPQSPALRTTLLSHTKRALETMPPLCLSTASPDRPPFLNKHVLQEMESFTGLLSESDDGGPCVDGLQIRLALNLARGSVAGLLKLITSFMGSKELTLPCADLLSKALAARSLCWEKIAIPLTVKCEGSDGGRGPLNTGPEVVLESQTSSTNVRDGASSSASSSRVYLTDEGKTFCTMLFKAEENVQLSKVRIQVASGVKGPQHGMVFVYNPECVEGLSDKADFDEHIKYFSKYDFWGDTEFKFSIAYRDSGLGGLPDNPVAFFKFEQDWDELEVPIQWSATGRYIMVKFLDPRHAFATRLGIKTIRLFGIPRPAPMARDIEKTVVVSNNPKKSSCTLSEIVLVILTFISDIAVDQLKRKNRLSSYKPPMDFLDLSDLDVMTLWNLHHICTQRHQEAVSDGAPKKVLDQWQHSAILALHLIHGLIPVLASSKVTSQMSRDSLFQQLCQYVNQEGKEDGTQQQQQESQKTDAIKRHKLTLIRQIIIDGAPLFFPEKTKKRNELFKLLEYVSDQSGLPSTSLVFQSLCQFFSAVDPKGLLELPSSPNKDFSPTNALGMMKSLLLVACQEKTSTLLTPPPESPPTPTSTQQHNGPNSQTGKDPHNAQVANTGNKAETGDDEKAGCVAETNQSSGDGGDNPTQHPTDFVDGVTALRSGSSVDAFDTSTPSSLPDNKKQKEEEMKEKDLNPQGGEASSPSLNSSPSTTSQPESNSAASDNDSCDTTKAVVCSPDDDSLAGKDKDKNGVGRGAGGQGMTYLVKLTTSLQGALMTWCWQQLDHLNAQEDSQALLKVINHVVANYTQQVMDNALLSLEGMKDLTQEQMKKKASLDEPSFLCNIVRQQCLFLSLLVDKINTETRVKILESSKKVLNLAGVIARANPDLFTDNTSPKEKDTESEDTVLRTWEVESPHEYHNHSNINQMFHCPGATRFVIDFDPRCETERRYDYLEFVDAKGLKMRLDHKVGMAKWPKQVTFSGPHVSFLFHSDSSNTEWGYKFTVTAKGSPDVPFSWLMDLHLGLVKVLGRMSGAILASNPTLPQDPLNATVEDRDGEQDILRSDLWTSLFRGGYRQGGKLQRSLSGKFATGDDSEIHSFLLEVVHHFDGVKSPENSRSDSEERQRSQVARFLVKCQESWTSKSQVRPGGMAVDKALMSVFVALLWHCQQLREDVDKFIQSDSQGEITEGIVKAYNMAESLRLKLASERQTWNGNDDKEEDQDPAQLLSSKCMFLLKFAGLTKVQLKNELRSKFYKQMMLKKAGNKPVIRNEVLDKYPSFRLVMEFVQDPAWTSQRVHQLLQERTEFASAIRDVYMFASETVRILSDGNPFQIPVVLYLQEMFSYQSQFSHHYADGLDGCGLEQEAQVRQAFYKLVRILVQPFKGRWINNDRAGHQGYLLQVYDMVQCCLLHLLDIEWQPYDLSFVNDLCLPQLYFNIAKETVKMRDLKVCEQNEEEELKQYEQTMIWFHEVSDGLNSWFRKKSEQSKDDKKAVKMFVARFSDVLDVEISCDGCSVTLPGRRYRCLQCLDMDLCTSCFSGGVEPQEHRDDHEIVHLVYKCNHCQAFIMGKRIHCNQCDDFDLCLGCHTKKKFPHGHNQDHDVTVFPMVKLKTSQSSNSPLRAYIHQHSWLMYTSLTLTLSDLVYGQDNGYSFLDPDYIRMAGQLQMQCVALATQCLQHNIDVEKTDGLSVEKRMEESFARHSQERVMGLLGAVMPSHEKRDVMSISGFNFWTQEFLDLLLGVTRGDHNHELNTQHQALRLMGRLLLATDIPAVTTPTPAATPAVPNGASATSLVPSTADQDKQYLAGKETISLLFSHGAKEFERRGLEWACSVARMLEMLFASSQWRPVINAHITQCVQNLTQKVDLACIFPMFVVAGFPEVLTTGTLVEYNDTSVDTQKGVVLKHFPDKYQTLIVNLASRKRHTVKDQWVSCYTDNTNTWDSGSLDKFVNYVIHIVGKIRMGEDLSVETLWVLSLTLKVLDRCLKAHQEGVGGCLGEELSSHAFIQALVFLACKGTSLNHHWLLRDLEVLSLIWYTQDGNVSKRTKISNLKDKNKKKKDKKDAAKRYDPYLNPPLLDVNDDEDDDDDDDDDDDNKGNTDEKEDEDYINRTKGKDSDDDDDDDDDDDSDSSTPDIDDDDDDDDDDDGMDDDSIWESMSDEDSLDDIVEEETWEDLKVDSSTKALLETLHRELNFDPFVLTAVYKMNKGNMEEVIKSLIDNAVEKDSVSEVIDKWKATKSEGEDSGGGGGGKKEAGSTETNTIDTGVSLHTSVGTHHKIPEVAEKEKGYNLQNLFTHHDKLESAIKKKQRAWSSTLFKKEVEKHGRSGSREYLLKINLALCVLYGRHTLTSLLAQWPPTGPAINSTLLGCKDVKQIPCVLDLLHKIDTRDFFSKVVDKVIHLCDGPSLVAIAYTAAQFMEEVTLSAVTRESNHPYTQSDIKKGHITLPGASYLTITFDNRCATAEEDTLIFSTRDKMDKDDHTFSGLSRDCWTSFHLPGDSLYYKFYLDDFDSDLTNHWGYKFTVTAGTRDSFETGHTILEAVLSSPIARSLPLGQLWDSLIYVSVKQAGLQRLKAIHLMLKILGLQHKGDNNEDKAVPDIDLCLLRPLWELYESLTPDPNDSNILQPAAVGALTDLFLKVEELASEWGLAESYLVSLISKTHLRNVFMQGLRNVAIVGQDIKWPNVASQAVMGPQAAQADKALRHAISGKGAKTPTSPSQGQGEDSSTSKS